MITVQGKLLVYKNKDNAKIQGRLQCSIGEFNVKSDLIATLEAGEYDGFFNIAEIKQGCYDYQGKYYFEVEAVLDKIAFLVAGKSTAVNHHASSAHPTKEKPEVTLCVDHQQNNLIDIDVADADLFGSLWPLENKLQLDLTQSRDHLRAQAKRLEQLGYVFQPKTQVWYKDAVPAV